VSELLLKEIDVTVKALEDKIPANPSSSTNESIENGLRKELSKYFKHLDDAMSIEGLERIYYRNVKE
jgi:hypothetical protein